jgi:phosphohistidine phosphatase SixA
MIQILGMRHGEKDGDKLTPFGEQQIFAMGEFLASKDWVFDRIIYSGAIRTRQSLNILIAAMKLFNLTPEENENFIYHDSNSFFPNADGFKKEMEKIYHAGGTLQNALKQSHYARTLRKYITGSLLELAKDMKDKGQKKALVISHSPLIGLAAPNPDKSPYGLYECDVIRYSITKGKITNSKIIRAPIRGKTIW